MIEALVETIYMLCLDNPKFSDAASCHETYVNCIIDKEGSASDDDIVFCIKVIEKKGMGKTYVD